MAGIIVTVGSLAALYGIVQYGILEYDHLGRRPQGSMGHYMTYSGLLMLVIGVAAARVLFDARNRTWAGLVLPALAVALALTFTPHAWVGACLAVGLLLVLKDLRLLAAAPVLAALFLHAGAGGHHRARVLDVRPAGPHEPRPLRDGTRGLADGAGSPADRCRTGHGAATLPALPRRGRRERHQPPPPQRAAADRAERGLPALGAWLWFVAAAARELAARFRQPHARAAAGAGLAALAGMLAAGMFEYNFGDSEFLMLLLVVLTLPAAGAWSEAHAGSGQHAGGREAAP